MSRSSIVIEGRSQLKDAAMGQLRDPHPGEILKEEFLSEIGMSQNRLAHAIVAVNRASYASWLGD